MKLLREICDSDIGITDDFSIKYKLRKAVRVVLHRELDGKYATLHVGKGGYYKFPGGGVEVNENLELAIEREIQEEVGCQCSNLKEIGLIVEFRKDFEQIQFNYCYFATTNDTTFSPNFTQKEIANGFSLERLDFSELNDKLSSDVPETYEGKFVQTRALEILNHIDDKS